MFDQIWDLVKKYDSIVIYGHINPDGDCYGSQVGLKEIINLTNQTTGFYEKLGFDMLLFELEHYYDYSLQENNEIIRKII